MTAMTMVLVNQRTDEALADRVEVAVTRRDRRKGLLGRSCLEPANALIIAPCSNGNIALMVNLAKHAALPWDCILGAETARAYKPLPEAYRAACRHLGLPPGEVTMVAAHNNDLKAAKAQGLRTAFVARPTEHGPGQRTDLAPDPDCADISAADFVALASELGC